MKKKSGRRELVEALERVCATLRRDEVNGYLEISDAIRVLNWLPEREFQRLRSKKVSKPTKKVVRAKRLRSIDIDNPNWPA